MSKIHRLLAIGVAATAFLGCSQAAPRPDVGVDEELPQEEKHPLVGSWRLAEPYQYLDQDGVHVGHIHYALTFTSSRAVQDWVVVLLNGTTKQRHYGSAGYRIESDTEVVRIQAAYDHDEQEVSSVTEFPRQYTLDGDTLEIEHLFSNERSSGRDVLTRVADPVPTLQGTWVGSHTWDRDYSSGSATTTLELNDDGTYTWTRDENWTVKETGEPGAEIQVLSGNWENDAGEYFLTLTGNSFETEPPRENDRGYRYAESFADATLRFAYAPTALGMDRLRWSFFWNEMKRDVASNTWSDRGDHGGYWLQMTRQ